MRYEETEKQELMLAFRAQAALLIAGSFELDRALHEKMSKETFELFERETEERIEKIEELIERMKEAAELG